MRCRRILLGLVFTLTAACSGSDEMQPDADAADTTDGSGDVAVDAGADISVDATRDAADDAPEDSATDAPIDSTQDVAADATPDAAVDTSPDVASDTTPDVAVDVTSDATSDAPIDVVPDAVVDAGVDAADAVGDAGGSSSVLFSPGATVDGALFAITGVALNDALADRVTIGDLDGDDVADLAFGATESDSDRGQAAVFRSPIEGELTLADADIELDGPDFYSGAGAVAIGDVNGDGNADLAIGAWRLDTVWIWLGPHDDDSFVPTLETADVTLTGPDNSYSGRHLYAVDLDDDGDDELVVTMNSFGINGPGGVALVGLDGGIVTGDLEGTATIWYSDQAFANFGADVAFGDFDGDGTVDIVVGSEQDTPAPNGGGVHLIVGPVEASAEPRLLGDVVSRSVIGEVDQRKMCLRLDAMPSMNGNASDDVVCESGDGTVFVFDFATLTSDGNETDAIMTVAAVPGSAGRAGAAGGDIDGDGVGDLVVGSPGTGGNGGALVVFLGATGHVGPTELDAADGRVDGASGWRLGALVEVGDLTDDGYDDVVVAGPGAGTGGTVWGFAGGTR